MEKDVQVQINEMNQKLDTLLEYVNQQRLRSQQVDDLVADVSIIGKDVYDTVVQELDKSEVSIDTEKLKILVVKIVKNMDKFAGMMDLFENVSDLLKDATPLVIETIVDMTHKMGELEEKGYFEFVGQFGAILDNIVSHYSANDVKELADNVVTILDTVKSLTQPEMMNAANNAIQVFSNMETENIPEYSIFKAMWELRTPEMKKGLGFIITFLKNLSK